MHIVVKDHREACGNSVSITKTYKIWTQATGTIAIVSRKLNPISYPEKLSDEVERLNEPWTFGIADRETHPPFRCDQSTERSRISAYSRFRSGGLTPKSTRLVDRDQRIIRILLST